MLFIFLLLLSLFQNSYSTLSGSRFVTDGKIRAVIKARNSSNFINNLPDIHTEISALVKECDYRRLSLMNDSDKKLPNKKLLLFSIEKNIKFNQPRLEKSHFWAFMSISSVVGAAVLSHYCYQDALRALAVFNMSTYLYCFKRYHAHRETATQLEKMRQTVKNA